jgi:hypothetical protein
VSGRLLFVAQAIGGLAVIAGVLVAAASIRRYLRERQMLRTMLRGLIEQGRVRSRDDLVRIKRFLTERISYDVSKREDPRPFLRSSAGETLTRGEGFCGESARVAIRLLSLGGLRANRLYLQGPRWSHVIVEHRWEGGWRLFDSHQDPGTLMPDEDVGRIGAVEIARLRNEYRDQNPWLASQRLRLPRRPFWRRLSQCRPPGFVVAVAESPDLVRAIAGAALTSAGLLLLGILR